MYWRWVQEVMRPDRKVGFITCVFHYAYTPLTLDLDLGCNKTHFRCKFWLHSLDMKPFDCFEWYLWPEIEFKMSQEFPTASLDITEDFQILHSAYVYICYSILKAKTYNWLPNTHHTTPHHTHTHTHTQQQQLQTKSNWARHIAC